MKRYPTSTAAAYTPQTCKTFGGALGAFFADECPQLAGERTRQLLVHCIEELVGQFFPATNHLRPGQTVWPTVRKDAKPGYGQRIQDTRLTPVILTLIDPQEAAARAAGKPLRELQKATLARLCLEADAQGGCLTSAELARLTKLCLASVTHYLAAWEHEHQTVLPRRGTIHDLGPSLTHKRTIIHQLFIEQQSVQQTARATHHSPPAIQRYISAFRQVLLCRQKGMTTPEIAFATKMTVRLVKEYEAILDHYAAHGYNVDQFLAHEPHVEHHLELWINEHSSPD